MTARTALITGGSRGIGRAIALELGRLGYAVVVDYATRPDAAEQVAAQIVAQGGCAVAVRGDVAKRQDHEELIRRIFGLLSGASL